MSALDTITCRVGEVEGPFSRVPSGKFKRNGDPLMRTILPYWVVRVLVGTVLQDRRFPSRESADVFWRSLPAFDSTEADRREKEYHEERQRLNRG